MNHDYINDEEYASTDDTDPEASRRRYVLSRARAFLDRADDQRREHELWLADVEARKAAQDWADETLRRKQEEQKRIDSANARRVEEEMVAQRRAREQLERTEAQGKHLPGPLQYSSDGRHPKIFYRDVI